MKKKINWQGYSSEDRNTALTKVKEAILSSPAYLLNFNPFSDLAINLSLEVEEQHVAQLHKQLSLIIKLSELTTDLKTDSNKECIVFLHLSFVKGSGNLKIEIPEVPG